MPARIGPRRLPRPIFLAEWRETRGYTQKRLGDLLGVSDMTVSRWELSTRKLTTGTLDAIAEALGIEPDDLYHHPDQPSPNSLLRDQPQDVKDQAMAVLKAMRRTATR